MNQSKMFDKLQNWIDQLIISSHYLFKMRLSEKDPDFKPFYIDDNSFIFLLSELYEKTNEKKRLLTICENWEHLLLKNFFLEDVEWELLNKKSKQYENDHFSFIENLPFAGYVDYCVLLFSINYQLNRFILLHTLPDDSTEQAGKPDDSTEQAGKNTLLTIKERLIIIQYLIDNKKLSIPGNSISYIQSKNFICKLLDINIESLKKPLYKITDSMEKTPEKFTEGEATELVNSFERITDFFKSTGFNDLVNITEERTKELRKKLKIDPS